jgi:hypothetical protein
MIVCVMVLVQVRLVVSKIKLRLVQDNEEGHWPSQNRFTEQVRPGAALSCETYKYEFKRTSASY